MSPGDRPSIPLEAEPALAATGAGTSALGAMGLLALAAVLRLGLRRGEHAGG